MHESSRSSLQLFLDTYLRASSNSSYKVLEVGSRDVNGAFSKNERPDFAWSSVDIEDGPGVTHILNDPYVYPFADEAFDAVVSTSVFEHMEFFWLSFLEMARVCKTNGFIYINVPSNGPIHRFPFDAWRFYPDAGRHLAKWGVRNGFNTFLVEALMLNLSEHQVWADSIYVFGKNGPPSALSTETLESKLGDRVYLNVLHAPSSSKSIPHPDSLKIKADSLKIKGLQSQLKKIRKILDSDHGV